MFVGRVHELEDLNKIYQMGRFECLMLYGVHRVGKTALLQQFMHGKKGTYVAGMELAAKKSKELLVSTIALSANLSEEPEHWENALEAVFRLAEKTRYLLVIDAYPRLAASIREFDAVLAELMDRYRDRSKLMVILCGSSMQQMHDKMESPKSPLHGKITAKLELPPLDFDTSCQFFPHFRDEDLALVYGLTGGIPGYLRCINDKLSVADNIRQLFLQPDSILFEEPQNIMKREMREPSFYNSLLTALACGANKMSEICAAVGEEPSVCATYMKALVGMGLVKREAPFLEKSSRKSSYKVANQLFRFWYRFVPENYALIVGGHPDQAWLRIEDQLSDYMSEVFTDICRQYLYQLRRMGKSPVRFDELGGWWGMNPRTRTRAKIDLVGVQGQEAALFGACVWSDEIVELAQLEELMRQSEMFAYPRKQYYYFSKMGFTRECMDAATAMRNVVLIKFIH